MNTDGDCVFLDKAIESARARVNYTKMYLDQDVIRQWAWPTATISKSAFEDAIARPGLSFICECKPSSPSAGDLVGDYKPVEIAKDYEWAGADAISVVTEPDFFKGTSEHLREVSTAVKLPCMRMDFIVDEYQLYETKLLGAAAVLLACSILNDKALKKCVSMATYLGITPLVEARDSEEIKRAIESEARIIAVNTRDPDTYKIEHALCEKLRPLVPSNILFVAESGIHTRKDVEYMQAYGADAVLIGEALMTANDRAAKLKEMKGNW